MTGGPPRFRPLAVVNDARCLAHDTGPDHPEAPARVAAILDRLAAGPLSGVLRRVRPRRAGVEDLLAVHDEGYLLRFEEACLSGASYLDHTDNRLCYDSYEAALVAAGAGLTGVDLIEGNVSPLVFCAVRPPGHHAERAMPLGFCFLNNAAVAAAYWRRHHGRRIFIFDFDAHHGNGIQEAFDEEPDVFYSSIHEHPTYSFPGTGYAEDRGTGPGRGATLNVPLPPGAGAADVARALESQVGPAVAAFRPDAFLVAAGFDGHAADDMSGLAYDTGLFGTLGLHVAAWAARWAGGRVLCLLEGGYHLEALAAGAEAFLAGLALEAG
ncbi:histone deacetylase [Dissulfurirhabdus thermomarina]|uniref:histone deacetylase n=1 Tax=Dissulfurirhabdus thermomarina TaxID=1765737 RepID=UPI0014706B4A|nr:histone deacetylase [Dissulfurirhabdus thermomarina]